LNTPPLPDKKYNVLLCDPPWAYANWSDKAHGAARAWYDCLKLDELKLLPVGDLAADNCALFLWTTGPKLAEGAHLPLMWAWGFRSVTMAFSWVKTTKAGGPYCGLGFYTRSATEHCLLGIKGDAEEIAWQQDEDSTDYCMLGIKGKMARQSASVRQLITAPRRLHSQKPDEQYERIEELFGDVPRIELFARAHNRPGWDTWGLEKDEKLEDIKRRTDEKPEPDESTDSEPERAVEPA
jgi:site-specific DNA-methyltransferase (adenine-specific)